MTEQRAESIRVMHPLFQAEEGGSTPTSALQLRFDQTDVPTAIALNRLWHSRLPRLVRGNVDRCKHSVCYVAHCGGVFYASAVWSSPVSRRLPPSWLELRRLAIAPDAPKNTASRMLGWMARDVGKRFADITTLVSYQDTAVHTGGIYRAAGWTPTAASPGGQWAKPSRHRKAVQSAAPKQRWERVIR